MHAARHAHAAEGFPPSDGIGLVACRGRKRIRRFGAPTNEAVNLFLDVDERLFHDVFSLNRHAGQSKQRAVALFDLGGIIDEQLGQFFVTLVGHKFWKE